MKRVQTLLIIGVCVTAPVHAFQLYPTLKRGDEMIAASDNKKWVKHMNDVGRWALNHYSTPVHEAITNTMYQCQAASCPSQLGPTHAPEAVLAGVRWNDNPPFVLKETRLGDCAKKYIQLPVEPVCWALIFKSGEFNSKRMWNPVYYEYKPNEVNQYALLLRSHFGDLQFLHSMASKPKEHAGYTRDKILMWAEYTWRIATGEFEKGTDMAEATQKMEIKSPNMLNYFGRGETVQLIFFKGEPAFLNEYRDFAFGSLLHLVQDSYSSAHVDRASASGKQCEGTPYLAPGAIEKFYVYVGQNPDNHEYHDTQEAFNRHLLSEPAPALVDVGKALIEMKERNEPWDKVKPYFKCLFHTSNSMTEADNGGI